MPLSINNKFSVKTESCSTDFGLSKENKDRETLNNLNILIVAAEKVDKNSKRSSKRKRSYTVLPKSKRGKISNISKPLISFDSKKTQLISRHISDEHKGCFNTKHTSFVNGRFEGEIEKEVFFYPSGNLEKQVYTGS